MTFKTRALAYYRTSSASNVGEDKDTRPRQEDAVKKYALLENIEIVKEFYDSNVMGTIPIMDRPEFKRLFEYAIANSIDLVLVETANRFSRDVMIQLMGHDHLKKAGISLVPVDAPAHFLDEDNPTAEMIRIIIATVSMYEKKSLVKKLEAARTRKREKNGRCEGRIPPPAGAIKLAKELRLTGLTYREIGEKLSAAGYRVVQKNKETNLQEVSDRTYKPQSVKNMIEME